MSKTTTPSGASKALFITFSVLFMLAFTKVHLGVQSTIVGYRLGQLKASEAEVLERRSQLQMQLAKLTTREHLTLLAESKEHGSGLGSFAALQTP